MTEVKSPTSDNLAYAAVFFRKLLSSVASDPTAADFARLTAPILEIALAVYSEGRDESKRRSRLKAELVARNLDFLQAEIDLADPNADLTTIQTAGNWKAFDLADVLTEEIPPVTWLVKPFIARPGVTVFFGKPKAMKSLLVLDLCLHVAGGIQWLSSPPKGKDGLPVIPVKVVWLDLENGATALKRRMKAIAKALGMGNTRNQMLAYSMPSPWPDLSKIEDTAAMITRLEELGDVGLLVIDHLGQALSVDENSPLVSLVMGNIRQLAESCNLAIILIHHAKKGQGKSGGTLDDQLRGSGAILAGVDGAYMIERDKANRNQLTITPVAVRGPEAPIVNAQFTFEQDANLELTQARFWRFAWRDDMTRAKDAIIQALEEGPKNQTELRATVKRNEAGVSDEKIRNAIIALNSDKVIVYSTGNKGAKIYRLAGGEDEDE